jgi:transposase
MWVPPEDTDPRLFHAPTRRTVALFGAVQLGQGRFVRSVTPKFNARTFGAFLRQLLRHRRPGRRLVLVVDNARYHHARALAGLRARHRRVLTLCFLPPYSPDLNPIERVWKLTRRLCTHNQYFPHLDALVTAVSQQLDGWRTPNHTLVKLCGIT